MRSFPTPTIAVALLAAALALPAAALAQSSPTPAESSPPPATPMQQHAAHASRPSPTQMVEQRIADLHRRLHITPVQEPQWEQFAQVMRDNAKAMQSAFEARAKVASTLNAVDNMQSYAQLAQQHAENMQKLSAAFQALYNALSDEQKKAADETFRDYASRHRRG